MARTPYSPTLWSTGDLITAENMNKIEQGIKDIEDDIYSGEGNLADQVRTMIEVKNTQPTSNYNKLWAQPNSEEGILVPTEEELEDVVDIIAETFATNKAYAIGDYVIYDNGNGRKLYRFTVAHSAGDWSNEEVENITIGSMLKEFFIFSQNIH